MRLWSEPATSLRSHAAMGDTCGFTASERIQPKVVPTLSYALNLGVGH